MKNKLKPILIPLLKFFVCIFFDKKYIQGRYFDSSFFGYKLALKSIWSKNILRLAPSHKFPTALNCHISNDRNIIFHPNDINNFQSPGTYYQNFNGTIYIGEGTYIGPNVGIITANHVVGNLEEHEDGKNVILGKACWIGMNSVILPGVELGDNTIVAAGAVVNKSFVETNVLIGGIPARILKKLD